MRAGRKEEVERERQVAKEREMEVKGIGRLGGWMTESEDQGESDEGTRDSWRNA